MSARRTWATIVLTAALAGASCHGDIRFDESTTCVLDADCRVASLHCSAGQCVGCSNDTHCTTPGRPRCDVAIHRCVACGVTSDCAAGMVCHSGLCLQGCTASATCSAAAPRCDDGICAQCDDGLGCSATSAAKVCVGWVCVECKSDADCSGARPRCNAGNHACAQCQVNGDCGGATPLCDPVAGTCVAPI